MESLNKNKLYPVAMIGYTHGKTYPNVKKALEDPDNKHKMLSAFGNFAKLAGENKCLSRFDGMSKDIIDCVTQYPKVIIENHFSKDLETMKRDLEQLGEIRLPFPKITLIAGELTNNTFTLDSGGVEGAALTSTINSMQDGSVNLVYSCFLTQEGNDVFVNAIFAKQGEVGKSYYVVTAILSILDGRIVSYNTHNYNNEETVDDETMASLGGFALIAIHMLTISGGDIYIASPTPDEVAVNKKRLSKGKKPLVEFRLITIDVKKKDTEVTMHHGTHASPRQHWRRGHWRTAPKSGKKVWIEPMLVGDEQNGKIIKDYAVGHYEERRA